jgi:sigma-B regulation protein RsbU (phosphoserine phosphatase)
VAAGILVTAIKALFSSLEGGEALPEILAGCDRVVRRMNVKPFHMCLTLARVTPASLTLCQAAMPPVLLHRAASGTVEEAGLGGLPVGSKLPGRWRETTLALAPGDTLLFASDGFPELLDPEDRELGFEAARETFRGAAGVPAAEILERLARSADDWRRGRDPVDDMTFVAVRATGD